MEETEKWGTASGTPTEREKPLKNSCPHDWNISINLPLLSSAFLCLSLIRDDLHGETSTKTFFHSSLYRVVFSHPNERKNKRHTANRVEELCYAGRYSLRHHFRNVKHRIPKEVGRRNNLKNFSFFFLFCENSDLCVCEKLQTIRQNWNKSQRRNRWRINKMGKRRRTRNHKNYVRK